MCEHAPVKCPHNCGAELTRRELKNHVAVCPAKLLLCQKEMSSVTTTTPVQEKNYLPGKDRLVISVSPWIPLHGIAESNDNRTFPVQESNQIHDDDELVIGK